MVIEKMSSLSEIILEFRNSVQKDIDRAIDSATQRLLFGLIETTIQDTHIGMRSIHESINQLNQQVKMLQENRCTVIPEVYHTDLKLAQAVDAIDAEDDYCDDCGGTCDGVHGSSGDKALESMKLCRVDMSSFLENPEEEEEVVEEEEEEVVEEEEDVEEEDVEVVDDTTVEEENEGEAEEAVEEEDVATAATAEEEEEEEDENGLQELEVDGITYHYDSEGNVYKLDDDGEATAPVGRYSEESGEFELFEAEEEATEETLEEFTHKGKTYYKDSQNNVYNAEAEPLPYSYVNGRFVKHTTEA